VFRKKWRLPCWRDKLSTQRRADEDFLHGEMKEGLDKRLKGENQSSGESETGRERPPSERTIESSCPGGGGQDVRNVL